MESVQCLVVPTGESARALSGSGHMYELINAIPRIAFSISTAAHTVNTQFGEMISGEVPIICKGQLISKGLFAILEFFQKTNKAIRS